MTPEDIKNEFSRHPPDAPLMKAIRSWLEHSRNNEGSFVGRPSLSDGDRHFNAGRYAMTVDLLTEFEVILDEAEERRKAEDLAKH